MNEVHLIFGKAMFHDRALLISGLKDIQTKFGCIAQALDANKVISEKHLIFAAQKAHEAFIDGRNIAKDPGIEILRYASGERQIERALAIGISNTTDRLALILASFGRKCRWPEASELSGLIKPDECGCCFDRCAITETFHISREEIEAVGESRIEDLVLERVALVDTYK